MKAVAGIHIAVACLAAALGCSAPAAAAGPAPPSVVVTLKPLHSLVAGVMKGIGEPELLFEGAARPGRLGPAQRQALGRARVLFWLGPAQAPAVADFVKRRPEGMTIVTLIDAPGVRLMDARAGHRRILSASARPPAAPAAKPAAPLKHGNIIFRKRGDPKAATVPRAARRAAPRRWSSRAMPPARIANPDRHVWLDPRNAIAVVRAAAAALARADPANAARYRRNAAVVVVRIEALNDGLTATTRALRKEHYAVTNNALQYFEDHYLMTPALEFRLTTPRPAAAAVAAAHKRLAAAGIRCLFAPTALDAASGRALVAGTKARLIRLDVNGRTVPPGPDAYFATIRGIGGKITACLRP